MQGVKGVTKSMDDVSVYGRNLQEHDENLHNVLQIMRDNNMAMNLEKCCFQQTKASNTKLQYTATLTAKVDTKIDVTLILNELTEAINSLLC